MRSLTIALRPNNGAGRSVLITKLIIAFVVASGLVYMRPDTAAAVTPPDTCFAFNSGTGAITNYYDNEGNNGTNPACPRDVDIPATIGGVTVTTIGDSAFDGKALTAVTIPSSVTSIDYYGFVNNSLSTLNLPSSLLTIGEGAFSSNQLTSIVIPDSVTVIGDDAFNQNQLASVVIGNGVTSIGNTSFYSNPLTSLHLGSSVITIGNAAFLCNNSSIATLTIPDSVTTIGSAAFQQCHIETLSLGNSVQTIGAFAFGWNKLSSLLVPDSVRTIDISAFSTGNIASLDLGHGVTTIADDAFEDNRLTTVTIPSSVTTFGQNVFSYQTSYDQAARDNLLYPSGGTTQANVDTYQAGTQLVRVYTEGPASALGLNDQLFYLPIDYAGGASGVSTLISGQLINPAAITLDYVNAQNTAIHTSLTLVGTDPSGTQRSDYTLAHLPAITPPVDAWNPTPAEVAAYRASLAGAYYRIGQSVTFTAPTIDGYQTPQPATRTMVLGASTTTARFVYSEASHGALASTGGNMLSIMAAALGCIGIGVLFFGRRMR